MGFIRRVVIVLCVGVLVLLVLQALFSQDKSLPAGAADLPPTRPVTVQDVLDAHIPSPIVETVSFPHFSYAQAFPDKPVDDDQLVRIEQFHEAPMLADMDSMPAAWRDHYPASLPPVEQRLPQNPAVVRGPDGLGRYGGILRRCTNETIHVGDKLMPESFTRFDPSGRLMPALAWKWEVSDDNRVFTFHLRQGHKWSDGEPFTTADILWVANTLIGSAYWPSLPNWMQSTDGRSQLYYSCVLDWDRLLDRLAEEARASEAGGPPSVGASLAAIGGEPWKTLLEHLRSDADGAADVTGRHRLVSMMNKAFRSTAFYDPAIFTGVDLASELAALRARGASRLSKEEMERLILLLERDDLVARRASAPEAMDETMTGKLGLLMFRAAYADCVDRARVTRVKVEAVPDEQGDDSHIVRFTFPRPNAIFLEKTATFMFFRGIFVLSKHYTAPLHPDGSNRIELIDVLDWPALAAALTGEADSPAGRLAARMDPALVAEIAAHPPSADSPVEQRQRIIEAVNEALAARDFYDPAAWEGVDLVSEYPERTAVGFVELRRSRTDLSRCRELLVRADLLERVSREGLDSLDAQELFTLNRMLLRAALDQRARPGAPVLALNREQALNTQADNHPRRYSSWVNLMRSLGNYHPQFNRHYPTLRPWRIITEKADQDSILIRNPYYYRVDEAGNQLPYIDAIETRYEAEESNRLLKMAAGQIDFQVANLGFESFSYLKQHELEGGYQIKLWAPDSSGGISFMPLQPHKDPQMRALQDDPRFRHALSLALNRQEIIDICFDGMATPAQFAVPEGSKYYCAYQAKMSVEYDPEQAGRLLDAMGLDQLDAEGFRTFPDSDRSIIINVDTSDQQLTKVVLMACEYWRKIGLNVQMQLRSGSVISRMITLGIMDIMASRDGASYFGPMLAGGYAPTHPAECAQWGRWTSYIREGGRTGEPAPDRLREVDLLWENVLGSQNEQEKLRNWDILSRRTADDLPRIGVYTAPGTLVYKGRRIRNVPDLALSGWIAHSPGNCCPEIFWLDDDADARP